jgi:hypothetical protein
VTGQGSLSVMLSTSVMTRSTSSISSNRHHHAHCSSKLPRSSFVLRRLERLLAHTLTTATTSTSTTLTTTTTIAAAAAAAGGDAADVDTSKFRENAEQPTQRHPQVQLCTLSAEQVAEYRERGWVTPKQYRLPQRTLARIRADHQRFVERYRSTHPEFEDYCGAILNYDLAFLNYARDPHILNMVEQCIGPDFALWNSSFFAKPPRTGRRVPWHQVSALRSNFQSDCRPARVAAAELRQRPSAC